MRMHANMGTTLRTAVVIMLTAFVPATATLQATTLPQQAGKTAAPLPAPDKSYGVKSAPITMEVFADYQCEVCRGFYEQTIRQVVRDYVSSGKVYLVHRDFPLQRHKYSGEAARWANACAEVGQFDAAEAALYENQDAWGKDGNIAKYIGAALPAKDFQRVQVMMKGYDLPAPQATVASVDPMAGISHPCPVDLFIVQEIKMGYSIGAPGTPAFVITYKGHKFPPVYNTVSYPVLKQFFDSLLR